MKYVVWLLPFVMPFVVLGLIRLLCYVAGVDWDDPVHAVVASMALGVIGGIGIIGGYYDN